MERLLHEFNEGFSPNYRIGVIGDIHGKNLWEKIIAHGKDVDRWIFIADYVDSYTISGEEILRNLEKIIAYKKANMDSVVLLLGNHDMQYMYYPKYRCDGFRAEMAESLRILFSENSMLFQVAYFEGRHLFTHAGVSRDWQKKYMPDENSASIICDNLNMWQHQGKYRETLMEIGKGRSKHPFAHWKEGDFGGPIWADHSETSKNVDSRIGNQVVGHTCMDKIECENCVPMLNDCVITYCDVFDHNKPIEYLVIEFYKVNINLTPIRQIARTI